MNVSEKGLSIIKKSEGCRLESYKDAAGVWTIGYGHTKGVKSGQKITETQAEKYLKQDCATAEKNVSKYDSVYHWNQNQFDALVSFAFNIGSIDQLTAKGTRTIAQISEKIPEYCKASGKTLAGLVTRRAKEKTLFDTPVSDVLDEEAVRSLQEALNADKITDEKGNALKVDGDKGTHTTAAIAKVLLKSGAFDTKKGRYSVGSTGEVVKWLQMRLNTVIGEDIKELIGHALNPDGELGADTRLAIGLFQEMRGLTQDYKAGAKTISELLRK
jgi:GH24 family phage-related lysozyme (muramidase)